MVPDASVACLRGVVLPLRSLVASGIVSFLVRRWFGTGAQGPGPGPDL